MSSGGRSDCVGDPDVWKAIPSRLAVWSDAAMVGA